MSEEKEEKQQKPGKPWNNIATFDTYKEADSLRKEKQSIFENQNIQGMQVKVKRRHSSGKFVVKTRLHPDFEQTQKRSSKSAKRKNRKSSKRNSE